jgi:hypothetical protein
MTLRLSQVAAAVGLALDISGRVLAAATQPTTQAPNRMRTLRTQARVS